MTPLADRLLAHVRTLERAVMNTPGVTEHTLRRAVADRARGAAATNLAPDLRELVDAVVDHPTEADIEGLVANGRSDDEILEVVLAAATATGVTRMETALAALEER